MKSLNIKNQLLAMVGTHCIVCGTLEDLYSIYTARRGVKGFYTVCWGCGANLMYKVYLETQTRKRVLLALEGIECEACHCRVGKMSQFRCSGGKTLTLRCFCEECIDSSLARHYYAVMPDLGPLGMEDAPCKSWFLDKLYRCSRCSEIKMKQSGNELEMKCPKCARESEWSRKTFHGFTQDNYEYGLDYLQKIKGIYAE